MLHPHRLLGLAQHFKCKYKNQHRLQFQNNKYSYFSTYYGNKWTSRNELRENINDNGVPINHLIGKTSKISNYWIHQLKQVDKQNAIDLMHQLTPENALGYVKPTGEEAKSGTMARQVLDEKIKHEDKIILFRCGEFYETYGIDAVLLVAHCGLNPMGNKCRAGCPVRNMQNTLDRLTEKGFSAAIFEEIEDTNVNKGPTKKVKLKTRVLTQIVSPAYSTYTFGRCLQDEDIEFKANRPILGVFKSRTGYILSEAHIDERKVIISERLTAESVQALLDVSGFVEPIYISNDINLDKDLPFLQDYSLQKLESSSIVDATAYSQHFMRQLSRDLELDCSTFRISSRNFESRPRPIYKSTALQIGLIKNENVPNLISNLLTTQSLAYSQRFLYKWILNPPNQKLCDDMQTLCRALSNLHEPITRCQTILEGKIVSLLLAKQCNAALFNDIKQNVKSFLKFLNKSYEVSTRLDDNQQSYREAKLTNHTYSKFLPSLLSITESESGVSISVPQLIELSEYVIGNIENVVASVTTSDFIKSISSDTNKRIPQSFFIQNEELIRNKIKESANPEAQEYFRELDDASNALCQIINHEFPDSVDVMFDIFENVLFFKLPTGKSLESANSESIKYISVPEKREKRQSKSSRYTTQNVDDALQKYIDIALRGPKLIEKNLQMLCDALSGQAMQGIIYSCHFSVILQTIHNHVVSSKQKGWQLPVLKSFSDAPNNLIRPALELKDMTPYWIPRSQATKNDIVLDGIMLLTAPNMSGKSTLMRSALVAALLGNCGLFAPCASTSTVPRFDSYFLRTASYDIPSEDKSAFAVEMDDVRIVLRDSTKKSLVMMDEIGKGTSSREGASLAGALLEYLSERQVYTIFATHLHEILSLPLSLNGNTSYKRMGFTLDSSSGKVTWSYSLQNGTCTDSMALQTAKAYGIPQKVIARAQELGDEFNQLYRNIEIGNNNNHSYYSTRTSETPTELGMKAKYTLDEIAPIIEKYTSTSPQFVAYDEYPPVSLEGQSCIYVLLLKSKDSENIADQFYVGETESIFNRLANHRLRRQDCNVHAAVVTAKSKSQARLIESQLIQELKKSGYDLESDSDSKHYLFGSANL